MATTGIGPKTCLSSVLVYSKVFAPGRIWEFGSFPPDCNITDSDIYLLVAVFQGVVCGQDIMIEEHFEGWHRTLSSAWALGSDHWQDGLDSVV